MRNFQYVSDLGDLRAALDEARAVKTDRYRYEHLGRHRTALLIFFNNSLRTRLSTQKAARNLGMDVIVLDVNQGAWKLETERGVVMDGDKSEHLLEAVPVMAQYCAHPQPVHPAQRASRLFDGERHGASVTSLFRPHHD